MSIYTCNFHIKHIKPYKRKTYCRHGNNEGGVEWNFTENEEDITLKITEKKTNKYYLATCPVKEIKGPSMGTDNIYN